jgi:chaperonin GroEL
MIILATIARAILATLVLVTGGTVFTDQLDIKLERRVTLRLDPLAPWPRNETCLMARRARIQSVAYDQIRSKSLITDHMRSDLDRERLPMLSSTVVDGVAIIKVGSSSEEEVREQWRCYDDALSALHGS